MPWKYPYHYPAPTGLRINDDLLTWNPVIADGAGMVRYTVYAIPSSVPIEDADDEFGDGICGEYLIGVTYSTQKKVPKGDYIYAVCAYTPQSTESDPVFFKR